MDNIDKTLRSDSMMTPGSSPFPDNNVSGDTTLKTQVGMLGATPMSNDFPGNQDVADYSAAAEYFYIKGELYTKLETLSDNSGEAQVFLVEKYGVKEVDKAY